MGAKAAREEAVAVGNLHNVVGAATRVANAAREAVCPEVKVMLGVGAKRGHARGARRHVDLSNVREGHGKHAVGGRVAQVLLGHKGRVGKVIERGQVIGVKARLVKGALVERDVLVAVDQRAAHAHKLHLLELLVRKVRNVRRLRVAGNRRAVVLVCHAIPPFEPICAGRTSGACTHCHPAATPSGASVRERTLSQGSVGQRGGRGAYSATDMRTQGLEVR